MTEIFGTLGPACTRQAVLEEMFRTGLTGMRLNLSHCDLTDSAEQISAFHSAAQCCGKSPQLVIDTQGPELRLGDLQAPIQLTVGDQVSLGKTGLPVPSEALAVMEVGDHVLLDDGKLKLKVLSISADSVTACVQQGGLLSSRKSVKVVDKSVPMPVLTERDLKNIRQAAEYGVTGLLQPFVRSGDELQEVRRLLAENKAGHLKIFAKIESREGIENLENILPYADIVVIARGDLGNDMPLWQLPAAQKQISAACRVAGKPFVVVTQMLASMEHAPVPTRAEVSDIFNAVADGAWGVMLTGETAVGEYPVEAIRYLTNTALVAEKWIADNTVSI